MRDDSLISVWADQGRWMMLILKNTELVRKLQTVIFFPNWQVTIGDDEMLIVILGDSAYPSFPWLMKPYIDHLDSSNERFSHWLRNCRMTVECIFSRLKGFSCCIFTILDLSVKNMVITALCVLHNICAAKGVKLPPGWRVEVEQLSVEFGQTDTRAIWRAQHTAMWLREALKEHFNDQPQQCALLDWALPGPEIFGGC